MNLEAHPAYSLFIPKQAVGADLVYLDLFSATTAEVDLYLTSMRVIVSGAVAVTGVVGVDLHLTRTTAVGTGGTAATNEGTDKSAATFTALDGQNLLPGGVTARLTPTGGGTAGALLAYASVFTEEANAGAYVQPVEFVHGVPFYKIPRGTGIRVVQGAVASVGNIGFEAIFRAVKR